MRDELGMVVLEPFAEGACEVEELGFVKEGIFHPVVVIKTADIDFDGPFLIDSTIGCDVRVFVSIA